jgi:UDP-N-acetylglucosamine 2-epimerase (non-hydrolysing)
MGTNRLVGTTCGILAEAKDVLRRGIHGARVPDLWDGKAADRIAQVVAGFLHEQS